MDEYRELMEINEAEDMCKKYLEFVHANSPYASKRVNFVDAIETLLFNYHHEIHSKNLIAKRYMELEKKYYSLLGELDDQEERINKVDRAIECTMESDPRTFKDRECEYGWLFDRICDWRKWLKG